MLFRSLAELYLSRVVKRAKKEAAESAQMNIQMNQQVQMQSAQAKAQMDAQMEEVQANMKIAVNKNHSEASKELELIKFASGLYTSAMSSGKPIPEDIKAYVDTILKNAIQPQMMEQMQQAAAQQQVAQQAPEEMTEMPEQAPE